MEMATLFPRLYATSSRRGHRAFAESARWATDELLDAVLDLIEIELAASNGDVDALSPRLAPVVEDLEAAKAEYPDAQDDIEYVRLYLSAQMATACIAVGRWSRAYEWLLVGITNLPWVRQNAGASTTFDMHPERLVRLFNDRRLNRVGDARRFVLVWIGKLCYYSWKQGGLREMVGSSLLTIGPMLQWALEKLTDEQHDMAVDAACHLSSWLRRNGHIDLAKAVVSFLERAEAAPTTSEESKKTICILLSCALGEYTSRPLHEWATRGLGYASRLRGHERLQLLVNQSIRGDATAAFDEILLAARAYSAEAAAQAKDAAVFNYAQARVFDVLAPFLGRLIREGKPDAAVVLLGAWYGVPECHVRRSPVLACVPSFDAAIVYASAERPMTYVRDTDEALRSLTATINDAIGTSHTIADDPSLAIATPARPGVPDFSLGERLEQEMIRFYELARLSRDHLTAAISASGLLPIQSLPHPIQALLLRELGVTWPIVSSYEEPGPNRVPRKVLLWSAGTIGGPAEQEGVAAIFRAVGVEVDQRSEDLDADAFSQLYAQEHYDAIWINAHGEFAGPDPHDAHLLLSLDRKQRITIAQLAAVGVPKNGRRLLFLNICDGGNVMVTNAPPRLGIAPMLASSNQAVISHLWPVRNFVAATYGVLLADALAAGAGFFQAYCAALAPLRQDRPSLLHLLEAINPRPAELIDRVGNGPDDFSDRNLFNWGSPVFYE
jgi:hypothetical protein